MSLIGGLMKFEFGDPQLSGHLLRHSSSRNVGIVEAGSSRSLYGCLVTRKTTFLALASYPLPLSPRRAHSAPVQELATAMWAFSTIAITINFFGNGDVAQSPAPRNALRESGALLPRQNLNL
ncbi:hypothetical protein ECG_05648 [Echinococcus granulosus]|nr:hypothetical protein ECG_05648 [Echinococcus granulosus]